MADSRQPDSFRRTVVDALATAGLRRLQASWALSSFGQWTFQVILAVYAYNAGGATAVGLATVVTMAPAGLAAPIAGMLVDRDSRRDVLLTTEVARALALAGIAPL
jgi:MFS family permease